MRSEFVVARSHRNSYDHGVRAAGARLVEVGLADRLTGCGVRDTEAWEVQAALGENTAGVLYLAGADARPPLAAVVRAAHRAGVPVLVDAAAELPPAANLRRFIDAGADLVAFSGGKGIGGPSASGILCGRRRLVGAALLQQLDLDYLYEEWTPPANLIDKRDLPGVPRHGIGRSCKVGKEQIIGLLTALERFTGADDTARNRQFAEIANALLRAIAREPRLHARLATDPRHGDLPLLQVRIDPAVAGLSALEAAARLRAASPSIHVDATAADVGLLVLVPTCLSLEDTALIGGAFAQIMAGGG
jgi:L-seryl-tRNA(Ser) seleniumtransferase